MAVDFGKQVGPLPLGAWIIVVGGGLGIAWYSMRGGSAPVVVEDTSGTPGVGVGSPADWTPLQGTGSNVPAAPTTNEQWGQKAIQWLIAQNYPPTTSDSAVRKYLSGQGGLSVQETTLIGIVLVAVGPPPQTLPPTEGDNTPVGDPVPTGLRSTGQRKGGTGAWISLQWTPVPGFSAYRVWGPSGATFWDVSGNKVSMDWWVPNVTATYSFSVSTKDGVKIGPRSAPISVTYTRK
jgi:hypothetical protein